MIVETIANIGKNTGSPLGPDELNLKHGSPNKILKTQNNIKYWWAPTALSNVVTSDDRFPTLAHYT
jgi:hypothetical protein